MDHTDPHSASSAIEIDHATYSHEMIVPAAQNLDLGDDCGANGRIVDSLQTLDYPWMTGVEVGEGIGIEKVH